MSKDEDLSLPAGSKIVSHGETKLERGHDSGKGGARSTSISDERRSYWPENGPEPGTEGGPDPVGQTPRKGDLAEEGELHGPGAGSGA